MSGGNLKCQTADKAHGSDGEWIQLLNQELAFRDAGTGGAAEAAAALAFYQQKQRCPFNLKDYMALR